MYDASLKTIQGHQFKNWSAAKFRLMHGINGTICGFNWSTALLCFYNNQKVWRTYQNKDCRPTSYVTNIYKIWNLYFFKLVQVCNSFLETIYKFSRIDVLLLQQIIVLFLCGFFYFHDANVEVNHCSNILFLNKRSIGHITHMSKGIVLGSLETRLGKPIYHYILFRR